ncbi:hypothetical protein COLINT_02164 [Collinsella intestinalis DSM 13280]|uniref:Uncharacterized protein n=1 Tax=Collinsella intestinalis DSM 13280 TaxID=521003 RepID=C4F7Z9_9ACTN|nr:hypothetical protein COLINT_02164 [Collinsella intestinalis DSM 13280]
MHRIASIRLISIRIRKSSSSHGRAIGRESLSCFAKRGDGRMFA